MTTLSDYYLSTDEYQRALRGEVNLVVGRKGSGKTALFVQLRDTKRGRKPNIVVDLKPEGFQLIKLKERVLDFLTAGAQQHLITALWEYILLLETHSRCPAVQLTKPRVRGRKYASLTILVSLGSTSWPGDP